jgi:hypothetical protein
MSETATSFIQVIDLALRSAIFNKYKDILGFDDVHKDVLLYPKGVALRVRSERVGEDVLEFANLWRISTEFDWNRQRSSVARNGILMKYTDSNSKDAISTVKAIPLNFEYNVWYWSKDLDKLNQIAERYSFWWHQNPQLTLLVNDEYPLELNLHFGAVYDESTVEQMYDEGSYYVYRTPIRVEGWVFNTVDQKTIKYIHVELWDGTLGMDKERGTFLADWWIPEPPP